MKFSTQGKPMRSLESQATEVAKDISESREPMLMSGNGAAKIGGKDVRSHKQQEETLALLKLLAMGTREIEQGRFRDVEAVFVDLEEDGE